MEPFPYRLLRPLPAGGMCDLFLALRERDQRPVVIKQLNVSHRVLERSVRRFITEAALLSRFDHPNVVRRLDFGSHGSLPTMVLEHIPGLDLRELLLRCAHDNAPIDARLAGHICRELLAALDHVHAARAPNGAPLGLVHLDVNPANVLLGLDGSVVLTDFGIASVPGLEGDALSSVEGKLAFLAPERVCGEAVDARADLYAAGAVLYELTTLRQPFVEIGARDEQVLLRIAEGRLIKPREHVTGYDRRLAKLVLKALARYPNKRFQRAEEFADALAAFVPPDFDGAAALRELLRAHAADVREVQRDLYLQHGLDAETPRR